MHFGALFFPLRPAVTPLTHPAQRRLPKRYTDRERTNRRKKKGKQKGGHASDEMRRRSDTKGTRERKQTDLSTDRIATPVPAGAVRAKQK